MFKIIGYGEDALTYWALTEKLEYVLEKLNDKSEPKNCVLYYRPSFGRGEYYGEFDAILSAKEKKKGEKIKESPSWCPKEGSRFVHVTTHAKLSTAYESVPTLIKIYKFFFKRIKINYN